MTQEYHFEICFTFHLLIKMCDYVILDMHVYCNIMTVKEFNIAKWLFQ